MYLWWKNKAVKLLHDRLACQNSFLEEKIFSGNLREASPKDSWSLQVEESLGNSKLESYFGINKFGRNRSVSKVWNPNWFGSFLHFAGKSITPRVRLRIRLAVNVSKRIVWQSAAILARLLNHRGFLEDPMLGSLVCNPLLCNPCLDPLVCPLQEEASRPLLVERTFLLGANCLENCLE